MDGLIRLIDPTRAGIARRRRRVPNIRMAVSGAIKVASGPSSDKRTSAARYRRRSRPAINVSVTRSAPPPASDGRMNATVFIQWD